MENTAQWFKQFFHTLSLEQIDQYIADKKLLKAITFKLATDSDYDEHSGGGNLVVYYAANEGTADEPTWVKFYESEAHHRSLTPEMIKANYEWWFTSYPEFAEWAFGAFGGVFQIHVKNNTVPDHPSPVDPEPAP